nr:uncharacterized protein LOC107422397 isoform X2 [Ziziphus jujuba var. spinosa]
MAAEMVGGAFLSVSLQELCRGIHWMADLLSRSEVNDGLVNKLEIMLSSVSGVLNAAESKQITDKNVRQWVSKLKDEVCNAEDLVHEMNMGDKLLKFPDDGLPSIQNCIPIPEKRTLHVISCSAFQKKVSFIFR